MNSLIRRDGEQRFDVPAFLRALTGSVNAVRVGSRGVGSLGSSDTDRLPSPRSPAGVHGAASAALAATVSVAAVLATPADAAFPGENGRIAFEQRSRRRRRDLPHDPGRGRRQATHLHGGRHRRRGPHLLTQWASDHLREQPRRLDDEIFIMNANGGNPRPLTTNDDGDFDPAFTPDGRQIVFESDRDVRRRDLHHERERGQSAPAHRQRRRRCRSRWSPRTAAGSSSRYYNGTDFDLCRMSINGGNQTPFVIGTARRRGRRLLLERAPDRVHEHRETLTTMQRSS